MSAEQASYEHNPNEEEDFEKYSTNDIIAMIHDLVGENYDVSAASKTELIRTLESLRQILPEPLPEPVSEPVPTPITESNPSPEPEAVKEPKIKVRKYFWESGQYE